LSKKSTVPVVESWGLPSSDDNQELADQLSGLELALVVLNNSFFRWVDQCARAAGVGDLSAMDLLVLHFIIMRKRAMTTSALAFALSIQEAHPVSYSAKKLVRLGMLHAKRDGKEVLFYPTSTSLAQFAKYMEFRSTHLLRAMEQMRQSGEDMNSLANQLRGLSGVYEQAARSIASA
jgi:predicted MarR family transcription regulator